VSASRDDRAEPPAPGAAAHRMPHDEPITVGELEFTPGELLELLGPRLTERRRERIDDVLDERTYHVVTVLDGIYDRGNVSAVIRTAEALGYQSMHVVESQENFKEANRVTQGTDKWVDIERWDRPEECIPVLRERGYRIVATDPEAATRLADIDFEEPTALVFGNEHDGISEEMRDAADELCIAPMVGFAQSYNISVSAAIALHDVYRRRVDERGTQGDLTTDERRHLTALFYLRSVEEPERLLRGLLRRR